ncbi:hypothetical protein FRC03_004815 [Tulasnella sp. 419]|nr:hypothetical protein FRC03_004815 [Tulasnella sp. 419]
MSPEALKMVAVDYQSGLLERLNEQVKDTELENQSVVQTVISLAGDRSQALAWNYASQALNNSFFLDNLAPPPKDAQNDSKSHGHEQAILQEPDFFSRISEDYGSLSQLKSEFSSTALGMTGSGWVWLVSNQHGQLGVTATYGAGTMLVRARHQIGLRGNLFVVGEEPKERVIEQSMKAGSARGDNAPPSRYGGSPFSSTSNPSSPSSGSNLRRQLDPNPITPSRAMSNYNYPPYMANTRATGELSENSNFVAQELTPILCLSVHEHAWLKDHGVWGKEEYLKSFWGVVNWKKVSDLWFLWKKASMR